MKQYKVSYDVTLKPAGGGFCTSPLEIMRQMDDAQKKMLGTLRAFFAREKLEDQVAAVSPLPSEIGIVVRCSETVAQKLAQQPFVTHIAQYAPKQHRKNTPFFKF